MKARSFLQRVARSPRSQRAGQRIGRAGRAAFTRFLDLVLPLKPSLALPEPQAVRSVLLVRPNFRIGNTLLLSPLVPALRDRYPTATLDVLIGDGPAVLLDGLPVDRVHTISRRFVLEPWRFVALFRRLRNARYDLVLEGGMGSFSGALYGWLAGGRCRAGSDGPGRRLLHVRLDEPRVAHVYDWAPDLARQLGATCETAPLLALDERDDAGAHEMLRARGLVAADGSTRPFILLFPGGHLRKRWPDERWLDLCSRLAGAGVLVLVSLGPEEQRFRRPLEELVPLGVRQLPPGPIRVFAAILARAALVVTADSGPLHLAVAVRAPILALLQSESSRRYAPRGSDDRWLIAPSVDDAERAIRAHPAWTALTRDAEACETRAAAASP